MKLGIVLGSEQSLSYVDDMYGLALTWWSRGGDFKWHVGCRFQVLFGRQKFGFRLTTYSCPMFCRSSVVKIQDCVLKPKAPVFPS